MLWSFSCNWNLLRTTNFCRVLMHFILGKLHMYHYLTFALIETCANWNFRSKSQKTIHPGKYCYYQCIKNSVLFNLRIQNVLGINYKPPKNLFVLLYICNIMNKRVVENKGSNFQFYWLQTSCVNYFYSLPPHTKYSIQIWKTFSDHQRARVIC